MKLWDVSAVGRPWSVELDVCDLGGYLDFTRRAQAGTLSRRVQDATHRIAAVGALPSKLGLVVGKYRSAGLHAAEASYVPASSLSAFPAIVRSVWSSKMPLAGTSVILNLLDGPVGVETWACTFAPYLCCLKRICLGWGPAGLDSCNSSGPVDRGALVCPSMSEWPATRTLQARETWNGKRVQLQPFHHMCPTWTTGGSGRAWTSRDSGSCRVPGAHGCFSVIFLLARKIDIKSDCMSRTSFVDFLLVRKTSRSMYVQPVGPN